MNKGGKGFAPQRLRALRQRFGGQDTGGDARLNAEAFFVSDPFNRRYLSGFTGSAGYLLITASHAWLLTDFRYEEAARQEAPDFEIVRYGTGGAQNSEGSGGLYEALLSLLQAEGIRRLAFESASMSFAQHRQMTASLPGVELVPCEGVVEGLRRIKDEGEISLIREAVSVAEAAYNAVLPLIRPGVSEKAVALELEFLMRKSGAEAAAFDFIVASGERSSLPHGSPTDRRMQEGDFVTIDFGARVGGYNSDMTRTVVIRRADERQRQVYETVLAAQEAAIQAVKPGVTGAEIDRVARTIIERAGFGENFGHSTGHGVGLAVHEGPRLSPAGKEEMLEPGMVVTIEPGIYIPGWGGVRIEDTVLVTANGCEVLCRTDKGLMIL